MLQTDWNVVITTATGPDAFELVRDRLSEFGKVSRTDYWNVLVLSVDDVDEFLEDVEALATCNPSFAGAISRVMPVTHTFRFHSPEEFEGHACRVAREWLPRLQGTRFHVRMHRRGFKGRLSSQDEERFLDRFILGSLTANQSQARFDFDDPDYIIAVESVGQRAGMCLWTRGELQRYRLLKLD
jgi:tRNA(Ser,Leu) C12 N-acetylase TAN1